MQLGNFEIQNYLNVNLAKSQVDRFITLSLVIAKNTSTMSAPICPLIVLYVMLNYQEISRKLMTVLLFSKRRQRLN